MLRPTIASILITFNGSPMRRPPMATVSDAHPAL
jgi:hypothetical protein